jgi:hypothetical protein
MAKGKILHFPKLSSTDALPKQDVVVPQPEPPAKKKARTNHIKLRCCAITAKGNQCKNKTPNTTLFCPVHQGWDDLTKIRQSMTPGTSIAMQATCDRLFLNLVCFLDITVIVILAFYFGLRDLTVYLGLSPFPWWFSSFVAYCGSVLLLTTMVPLSKAFFAVPSFVIGIVLLCFRKGGLVRFLCVLLVPTMLCSWIIYSQHLSDWGYLGALFVVIPLSSLFNVCLKPLRFGAPRFFKMRRLR